MVSLYTMFQRFANVPFFLHRYRRKWKKQLKICFGFLVGCFFLFILLASSERPCPPEGCGSGLQNGAPYIQTFPEREHRKNSGVKRILRWTGFFTDETWEETDDSTLMPCKVNKCTITNNRSLLDESDAVLFHAGSLWHFWMGEKLPATRQPYQTWILYNIEPPPRTPLNLLKYQGLFNWTAWFRRDSDVPVDYGGYTPYPMPPSLKFNKSLKMNWFKENTRFSAWMSSNCYDHNRRQELIFKLKELLGDDMDLYGKCGGRRCPETVCYDTLSNYKFYFVFENSNCLDYITEKFWATLLRRQIPIVYGGSSSKDYAKIAPPHSYIHVDDFKDLQSLVDYLRYLAKNETAYNEYLEWTTDHDIYSELPARRKWWCKLCEALHDAKRPAQVYSNIHGWMTDDTCPQWTLTNQVGRWFDGIRIKLGLK